MENLGPRKVEGEYRSVMPKAPPVDGKEQKIHAVAEGSIPVKSSTGNLSNHSVKQEKSEGYFAKITHFFRNLFGWNKGTETKKGWLSIFLSAFHFYGSIHKATSGEEANLSQHNVQRLSAKTSEKVTSLAARAKELFLEKKRSSFSYFGDTITKLVNKMNFMEVGLLNIAAHLSEKLAQSKKTILDAVEERVVVNMTSYFAHSNSSQKNEKIDEAGLLENMKEDHTLPEAIYPLTEKDIETLSKKEELVERGVLLSGENCRDALLRLEENSSDLPLIEEIQTIEEKMEKQEYEAVEKVAAKMVDNIVFPEGVDDKEVNSIKDILEGVKTIYEEELKKKLALRNVKEPTLLQKIQMSNLEGEIVKLEQKVAQIESLIKKTDVREMVIELLTKQLISKIDKLSDPTEFSLFLAARLKPPTPNPVVPASELAELEANPLFDSLFFEGVGWLLPKTEDAVQNIVERAGTITDVASSVLPSNALKKAEEETKGSWFGGLVSGLNSVVLSTVEKVQECVSYPIKSVGDTLLKIKVAPRRVQNSVRQLKERAGDFLTEENLLDQLENQLEKKEAPPEKKESYTLEEAKLKTKEALQARLTSLDRIREGDSTMYYASRAAGLSEEFDQIQGALQNDSDFDQFVTRTVENKRLNKVAIHQVLQGVVQGLEDSEFFERT